MTDPRYPVGPAPQPRSLTPQELAEAVAALRALPDEFARALSGLSGAQLDTPYREGGWTLRQLAHHLPDSHVNAYVRMKLALTETRPVIKPYDEAAWATLPDSRGDIAPSLTLLGALHTRWSNLLTGLDDSLWHKTFVHPEVAGETTVAGALLTYVWHGRHHTAHVLRLRDARGW